MFNITAVFYSAILSHNMPFPATSLLVLLTNQSYILALLQSDSAACHFYTGTARSTFPLVNPCSCCVVFVVSVQFPILEVSRQIQVLRGETVSLTPNPQPGGPGYPFLSRSSPLTCLAHDIIPVASLLPAKLSGSFDHASPTTTSKWGATVTKILGSCDCAS